MNRYVKWLIQKYSRRNAERQLVWLLRQEITAEINRQIIEELRGLMQ